MSVRGSPLVGNSRSQQGFSPRSVVPGVEPLLSRKSAQQELHMVCDQDRVPETYLFSFSLIIGF